MMDMTTETNANITDFLVSEFEQWQQNDSSEIIFLLEVSGVSQTAGSAQIICWQSDKLQIFTWLDNLWSALFKFYM